VVIRAQGTNGWFGWYGNPAVEALIQQWLAAPDDASRIALRSRIQDMVLADAPTSPLGQYFARTAFQASLSGVLPGSIVSMWNVKRS